MAGVYAGGDIVTGAATVIEAMGAGRRAARSIKEYLRIRDHEVGLSGEGDARRREVPRDRSQGAELCAHPRSPRLGGGDTRTTAIQERETDEPMNANAMLRAGVETARKVAPASGEKPVVTLTQHVVEIVSDSGEGAQKCGQSLGAIAAKMGNGVWTEEIIPAEIRPPARSVAGGSGNRIRLGSRRVTNGGDETDLVVAFNEQVLLGRVRDGAAQARLHHPAREHVAGGSRSQDRGGLRRDL